MEQKAGRSKYLTANIGSYNEEIEINGTTYEKVFELRYGHNPHQTGAYYRPKGTQNLILGNMEILKQGKNGLSLINIEDINRVVNILKYFKKPAMTIIKHGNPCGVCQGSEENVKLEELFVKTLECDPRAAFGGVIGINRKVTLEVAQEIMKNFYEIVVAVDFEVDALQELNNFEKYGRNKEIRLIKISDPQGQKKFADDGVPIKNMTVFNDGTIAISDQYLSAIEDVNTLKPASVNSEKYGYIESTVEFDQSLKEDLIFAWYVNINVRSNGIVIAKNNVALAIGTGEQDRVGAVEQGIDKFHKKYTGKEDIKGAVLASDGFFPSSDSIELCAKAGIRAVISPSGSVKDYQVIETANKLGISLVFTEERCFSHH